MITEREVIGGVREALMADVAETKLGRFPALVNSIADGLAAALQRQRRSR